ncbi:teichoic acids export ATP-binding protein TagH [Bacillus anthracis]|nr:teichoic acids export ATP-binding protein TagH [Bacillus anthracis]
MNDSMNYKVKFEHVTKKYKLYNKPFDKLKDLFFRSKDGEYHYALNNISFEVPEGEIVGIVGLNGSGKSTLSNLIAGVTMPNKGTVDIKGSAALIAISSGLNGQLTGIENIELKGLMMGITKEKIKEIIPEIIDFADIGKFMYQPVKTYSSGMKSRLGFAISVHINPDILVIDEALSVGDQTFTKKCLDKMNEFKEQGKTIFFISHSLSQVKSFCTKALWLHYGQVKEYGDIKEIVDHYDEFLKKYNQMSVEERKDLRKEQISQFQHGLLQEDQTGRERKRKKGKKQAESLKRRGF